MKQGREPEGTDSGEPNAFRLRVVPWWTDDCSTFLNNVFKWLPGVPDKQLTVLEFGGGNSTFYLLSKKCKVVTVESDQGYIDLLINMARQIKYTACAVDASSLSEGVMSENDLVILKAQDFSQVHDVIGGYSWNFVVNDGISRREVLSYIQENAIDCIVILDNVEYCANWGRLDRSSAKPDLIRAYRSMLRDSNWRHYVFEQAEGRGGRGSPDKTGWESPHRWASAVLWPQKHLLSQRIVSSIGLPLVNEMGEDDSDVETLAARCPFDWEKMQWVKGPFPEDLDLKLSRKFD